MKRYVVTCVGGAWLCTPAAYKRVLKRLRDDGCVDLDTVPGCKYLGSIAQDVTDGLDDDDDDVIKDEFDRLRSAPASGGAGSPSPTRPRARPSLGTSGRSMGAGEGAAPDPQLPLHGRRDHPHAHHRGDPRLPHEGAPLRGPWEGRVVTHRRAGR